MFFNTLNISCHSLPACRICYKVSLKSDGLAVGSGVSQILFWPAGTWSQGPGSPEACASLLVSGLSLRVNAGPLVGGAGSWSL